MSLKRACEAAVVVVGVSYSFSTENETREAENGRGAESAKICPEKCSPIINALRRYQRGLLLMNTWRASGSAPQPDGVSGGEDYPFDTGAELSDFEAGFLILHDVMAQLSDTDCNPYIDELCVTCCYEQELVVERNPTHEEVARITPNTEDGTVDIEFKLLLRDADFKPFSAQAVEPHSVPRLISSVMSLDIGWRAEMKRLDLDTDEGKRMFAVMVRGYMDDMSHLLAEYDIM